MPKRTLTERLSRVLGQLNTWRDAALRYKTKAASGELSSYDAASLVSKVRDVREEMLRVPRTAAAAAKATEEWDYQGNIATDFVAIETALDSIATWISTRDASVWTGWSIDDTYPFTENIPTFSAGQTTGLQTAIDDFVTTVDTFLSNIQET